MAARAFGAVLIAALLALCGCGGSGGSSTSSGASTTAGNADPADVDVIDGWATTLRHGDVRAAAQYFAIPSVAENGPILVHLRSLDGARRFNASLPCGARLIRAETVGEFTTATFRLTERPGRGTCGSGVGAVAMTSFVIRNGKIAQWRRVGEGAGGAPAPSTSARQEQAPVGVPGTSA